LAEVKPQQEEAVAGAVTTSADIKGRVIEFLWHLKKEGYSNSTIEDYGKCIKLLIKRGANLFDGESVKGVIAKQESWGPATKLMTVAAYTIFAFINGIAWKPPKYKADRKLPFIPLESEIDALISSSGKKMSSILQLLKETGMRIGEACQLKWVDVDLEHDTITVNAPEKNGRPRTLKISARLVAMLNALTRENEYVFGRTRTRAASSYFCYLRKHVANKLQNPRIKSIHLHTFRHWYATMEYHKTKDILHVMRKLGHRRIDNTLIYTQLVQYESDEYHSAVAENIDDAKKLIEAGFEYVCTHENHMLFKKRK